MAETTEASPTEETPEESPTEKMRKMGHALIDVANALEGFPREAQIRVVRAVAILHGYEIDDGGLRWRR